MTGLLFEFHPAPVNGERIRLARELRSLTQSGLADLLGVDQTMVAHMERGAKQPNSELLQALADVLRMPTSFFRQGSPPDLPKGTLLFRAKAGLGKRFVAEAHAYAQLGFEAACKLSRDVNPIPVSVPAVADPIEAAQRVRKLMQLGADPLVDLVRKVERLGVWVLPLPETTAWDAFAVWGGATRDIPVIGVVPTRPGDRLRMSIAHELGHLVLHRDFASSTPLLEEQAYKFAGELLMPADSVILDLRREKINLFSLAQLKKKWFVSMQAMARRARDLQLISDRQYRYLMQQISIRGWRTEEPEFGQLTPAEKPRAVRKMAEVVFGPELDLKYLANHLNLSEDFLRDFMSAFAPAPGEKAHLELNRNAVAAFPTASCDLQK